MNSAKGANNDCRVSGCFKFPGDTVTVPGTHREQKEGGRPALPPDLWPTFINTSNKLVSLF